MEGSLSGPLTTALREQLAVNGIVWSHVEMLGMSLFTSPFEMRTSHFRAMDVSVSVHVTGHKVVTGWASRWWEHRPGPDNCPNCGFRTPWIMFFHGPEYRGLIGLTPDGLVDVSKVVTQDIADLFEAAQTNPSIALIGASEAPIWADLSGTRLRGVAVDMTTGATLQSLSTTVDGRLVVREGGGEVPIERSAVFPQPGTSNHMLALSGALGELYQLAWTEGGGTASLTKKELPSGTWEPVALHGVMLPRNPVAMTYRHEDRSIYVIDMPLRRRPPLARLLQILPDGTVKLRAAWITGGNVSAIHLSTARNGNLLLGVSRPGRFRAVEVDPSTPLPRLVSAAQSRDGELASPLRSDEAGVTAAVRDEDDTVSVNAVDLRGPGHWLPAWKPDWCFE